MRTGGEGPQLKSKSCAPSTCCAISARGIGLLGRLCGMPLQRLDVARQLLDLPLLLTDGHEFGVALGLDASKWRYHEQHSAGWQHERH
jgi:hypothetical protein